MSDRNKEEAFEEMAAAMSGARLQAAGVVVEPSQTGPIATEGAGVDNGPVEPESTGAMPAAQAERENEATTTTQSPSPLAGLDLDTAIRFRWALRDIKAKRTKLTPVSPDDLGNLIEMGLVEMRDDVSVLTNEGHRALDEYPSEGSNENGPGSGR